MAIISPVKISITLIDPALLKSNWAESFCTSVSKVNLILASKIVRKLINLKKNIKNKKNKNKYLLTVKDDFQNRFKIKIEYLELRDINDLKLSNSINTSRLFVAYYLNGVRLIDNL